MIVVYLIKSDRIVYEMGDDEYAKDPLKVAEEQIEYVTFKALDRSKIIKKIVEILEQFPKNSRVWIYGSFFRMEDRSGSDIEIAVKTGEGFSYFEPAEIPIGSIYITTHGIR